LLGYFKVGGLFDYPPLFRNPRLLIRARVPVVFCSSVFIHLYHFVVQVFADPFPRFSPLCNLRAWSSISPLNPFRCGITALERDLLTFELNQWTFFSPFFFSPSAFFLFVLSALPVEVLLTGDVRLAFFFEAIAVLVPFFLSDPVNGAVSIVLG